MKTWRQGVEVEFTHETGAVFRARCLKYPLLRVLTEPPVDVFVARAVLADLTRVGETPLTPEERRLGEGWAYHSEEVGIVGEAPPGVAPVLTGLPEGRGPSGPAGDGELLPTAEADLIRLWEIQTDPGARWLAAFVPEPPETQEAYLRRFTGHLADPSVRMETLWVDGRIAGSVGSYLVEGDTEVTYWLDRAFWGRGLATLALADFVRRTAVRPLHGRVVADNPGSRRVLEACGFVRVGQESSFAPGRQAEVVEFLYRLDAGVATGP